MPTIPHAPLRALGAAIFRAAGVPDDQAQIAIDHLVESNLMGHDSHGVMHVPRYTQSLLEGTIRPAGGETVLRETPVSQVIDANGSFGIVYTYQAMQAAVERAQRHTLGAVAMHNVSHIGRLGAFPPLAAQADCIGILTLNGGAPFMAPFGGVDRRLPPNPIAISVPTLDGPPLVLDMTTSMVAGNKARVQQTRGEPLPEGWVIDDQGNTITDPAIFLSGKAAMLPLGGPMGYKGYGLNVMLDAITGGLSWAGCTTAAPTRGGSGVLALAIKIASFIDVDEYKREVQGLIEWVRSSRTMPDVARIYLPGEKELESQRQRMAEGIPLPDYVWEELQATAAKVEVPVPAIG